MTDELQPGAEPELPFEPPKFDSEGVERRARAGLPLAILALAIPTATGIAWLLGWGVAHRLEVSMATLLASTILVTWDAARLGRRDCSGVEHESPGLLFVGMLALWVIVYPSAYFRRRHFGGPNLGPLALVAAALFVGVPLVSLGMAIAGRPPACTSPDVTIKVEELAAQFYGDDLKSVAEFSEQSFDEAAHVRRGRCIALTDTGPEELEFQVEKPPGSGLEFFVRLPPPRQPPRCKSPAIMTLLHKLATQVAGPGTSLKEVKQVAFDPEKHQRRGECAVRNGDVTQQFHFMIESREHPGAERDYQVVLVQGEVPLLRHAAVVKQLETILRSSAWGREIESVAEIAEESFDREANLRLGRAVAILRTEKIPVGIAVGWQDAAKGLFEVRTWPLELPSCRNPQVVDLLTDRLRQRDPARPVERVDGIEELSSNPVTGWREGRCVVHDGKTNETVRFRVQWIDRENVTYAVLLEGDLPPDATL